MNRRLGSILLSFGVIAAFLTAGVAPAQAASRYLCTGYTGCADAGYSPAGYQTHNKTMYWRMSPGHNCTNYVAYRMVKNGLANVRPWSSTGNAYNWGPANASKRDLTPVVGATAWWKKNVKGAGSLGHVAYVERVVSIDEIVISEDNWGGNFHWRRVKRSSGWPSGFLHFKDSAIGSPRGALDSVTSPSAGRLSVTGWAYDPNRPKQALRIRAYVGGRPKVGTKVKLDQAALPRTDVARAHPQAGPKHGFSQTVTVKKTGRTAVYVYALDVNGTPGRSTLLGIKNVTIKK